MFLLITVENLQTYIYVSLSVCLSMYLYLSWLTCEAATTAKTVSTLARCTGATSARRLAAVASLPVAVSEYAAEVCFCGGAVSAEQAVVY